MPLLGLRKFDSKSGKQGGKGGCMAPLTLMGIAIGGMLLALLCVVIARKARENSNPGLHIALLAMFVPVAIVSVAFGIASISKGLLH